METISKIDNSIYNSLGERWYTAWDDPVALLRAENKLKVPWISERIAQSQIPNPHILDVGCGAGFLCNELVKRNYKLTGVDISEESLIIAKKYDQTQRVNYVFGDAYQLPFSDSSFEVITCLDFLEHVENPAEVIKEISRVLKPGGLFFFHTFNRNIISWLLVIKAVEFFIKNTPKNMHVIDLFIRPDEMVNFCNNQNMEVKEMIGLRPLFSTIPISSYFSGIVPESLSFTLTRSLLLSYMGMAQKKC